MMYLDPAGVGDEAPLAPPAPEPTPAWVPVAVVVGGAALLGLVVWGLQQRYQIMRSVAKREGSSGVLKLAAGEAAIDLASAFGRRAMR